MNAPIGAAAPGAAAPARPWLGAPNYSRAATFVLIGALVFNAGLCFVNTNVLAINASHVMLCELVLISAALALALSAELALVLTLALFLSYMALIMALRPELDLKATRDFLIPIAFYFMGRQCPDIRLADRIVAISAAIVVVFGLFEFLFLDLFLHYFNVIQYYIARGTVAASEVGTLGGNLFVSGVRPETRTILPFLGQHRASSVFLEPVSMGNFGAILFIWALVRRDMKGRLLVFAAAATVITLSDARFGLYVCIAAVVVDAMRRLIPKPLVYVSPFLVMAGLAIYGMSAGTAAWKNDLAGRLYWTAHLLVSLDWRMAAGISADKVFLSDSGYAQTLSEVGLLGFAALWAAFVFSPASNAEAWRLRLLVALYLGLLLVISDSPYSIKTAALLWFCLGAHDMARPVSDRRDRVRAQRTGDDHRRPSAAG